MRHRIVSIVAGAGGLSLLTFAAPYTKDFPLDSDVIIRGSGVAGYEGLLTVDSFPSLGTALVFVSFTVNAYGGTAVLVPDAGGGGS